MGGAREAREGARGFGTGRDEGSFIVECSLGRRLVRSSAALHRRGDRPQLSIATETPEGGLSHSSV